VEKQEKEAAEMQERRARKQVERLTRALNALSAEERSRLKADLSSNWLYPLIRIAEAEHPRQDDIEALRVAYSHLTEAGVEELALDMPHDVFWAVAGIGLDGA